MCFLVPSSPILLPWGLCLRGWLVLFFLCGFCEKLVLESNRSGRLNCVNRGAAASHPFLRGLPELTPGTCCFLWPRFFLSLRLSCHLPPSLLTQEKLQEDGERKGRYDQCTGRIHSLSHTGTYLVVCGGWGGGRGGGGGEGVCSPTALRTSLGIRMAIEPSLLPFPNIYQMSIMSLAEFQGLGNKQ